MTYSSHSGRDRSSGRAWIRLIDVAQLLRRAGRRHGVVTHVEVEVEVGVLDPVRQVEPERHLDEPAAERDEQPEPFLDEAAGRLEESVAAETG